ncbi:hypothetical protein C8R44DRAFT_731505 [Mycena epipterygia]|nr:hypothetical protein C8R44DRAFT_731505 [Mycena epipterygia]
MDDATMNDEDDDWVYSEFLTRTGLAAKGFHARSLRSCPPETFCFPTRKRTLPCEDGQAERFAYRDPDRVDRNMGGFGQISVGYYYVCFMARLVSMEDASYPNRLDHERSVEQEQDASRSACTVLYLKSVGSNHVPTSLLFSEEVRALQSIIDREQAESPGHVVDSWVGPVDSGGRPSLKVVWPRDDLPVGLGACLAVFVRFTRDDCIRPDGTLEKTIRVDYALYESGRVADPALSRMDYNDLPNISNAAWALPPINRARVDVDFTATRDHTGSRGEDVFSFKAHRTASLLGSKWESSRQRKYTPTLIGEVLSMDDEGWSDTTEQAADLENTYQVRLRSPKLASRAVSDFYHDQISCLRNVIDCKASSEGTEVETSWVVKMSEDDATSFINLSFPPWFFTGDLEVGCCIAANVWLYLTQNDEGKLSYSLLVQDYVIVAAGDMDSCLEIVEEAFGSV